MKIKRPPLDQGRGVPAEQPDLGLFPGVLGPSAPGTRPPITRVLVISPHPDDETIGCGGTLRKHVLGGHQVRVVFLTSGEKGGHGRTPAATRSIREAEACRAASILGLTSIEFWHEPDGAIRVRSAIVDRLRQLVIDWRPHRVYVTHQREKHPDHRAAHRLVRLALTAGSPNGHPSPEVYLYEVWTPLQQMDWIVDITPVMKVKLAAVRAYRSQCAVVGFDAAVKGLNRYRGELHSWPDGEYAEVFERLPSSRDGRSTSKVQRVLSPTSSKQAGTVR